MKNYFLTIIFFFLLSTCLAQVVVYPAPAGVKALSKRFQVTVTQSGVTRYCTVYADTALQDSYSLAGRYSPIWGWEGGNVFHFANFSFAGTATVTVTKFSSSATAATLRPNAFGLGTVTTTASGSNRTVTFTLTKASYVSVEFNDDPTLKDALMVFGDALEIPANVPSTTGAGVALVTDSASLRNIGASTIVYFRPGMYKIGNWIIPTTVKQVYIAGGAYIKGYLNRTLYSSAVTNIIKINGRGILTADGYPWHYPAAYTDLSSSHYDNLISLQGGENCSIEGITMIKASGFNIIAWGFNTNISNVKINGFKYNNDGINIAQTGIVINNCFIRDNDDSIDAFASNVTISNCIWWQLQGSEINLGGWKPANLSNYTISNCTILHDKAAKSDADCGFLSGNFVSPTTATGTISNFNLTNIYFDTPVLRFIDIRADRNNVNMALQQAVWVVRDIHLTNVYFNQNAPTTYPLIYIHGYDSNHPLIDFTFTNVSLNKVISSLSTFTNPLLCNQKNTSGLSVAQ